MVETYATGLNGFIGKHLSRRILGITGIPHEEIPTTHIQDFGRFFFLSSYGNMANQRDAASIIQANLTDPVDVLTRSLEIKYDSFIFVSTSSVTLPVQTVYSRAKLATEEICQAFIDLKKPICIVRPYSVTGVGEQSRHLIPTAIRSCLYGEKMRLVEAPVHDYVDVEDFVDGMIMLSDLRQRGVFEIGTGRGYTNKRVVEIVEEVTGKRANVEVVPVMRDYDTPDWVCRRKDITNLGWKPKKTLHDSISEMVKQYE